MPVEIKKNPNTKKQAKKPVKKPAKKPAKKQSQTQTQSQTVNVHLNTQAKRRYTKKTATQQPARQPQTQIHTVTIPQYIPIPQPMYDMRVSIPEQQQRTVEPVSFENIPFTDANKPLKTVNQNIDATVLLTEQEIKNPPKKTSFREKKDYYNDGYATEAEDLQYHYDFSNRMGNNYPVAEAYLSDTTSVRTPKRRGRPPIAYTQEELEQKQQEKRAKDRERKRLQRERSREERSREPNISMAEFFNLRKPKEDNEEDI